MKLANIIEFHSTGTTNYFCCKYTAGELDACLLVISIVQIHYSEHSTLEIASAQNHFLNLVFVWSQVLLYSERSDDILIC